MIARLYIMLVALALVATVLFFFWQLREERTRQRVRSEEHFTQLHAEVTALWENQTVSAAGELLSQQLRSTAGEDLAPYVVGVYAPQTGLDYLWAVDSVYLEALPNDTTRAPAIARNAFTQELYSRAIGEQRVVTALYPTLTLSQAFPYIRSAVMLLLIIIGTTILVSIIRVMTSDDNEQPSPSPAGATPQSDHDTQWSRPSYTTHTSPPPPRTEPDPSHATEAASPPRHDQSHQRWGLQPYEELEPRLDIELRRAGYHEQDLSVLELMFPSVREEQRAINAAAVRDFFAFEDLCFRGPERRSAQNIFVILTNTSLSEALSVTERFQRTCLRQRTQGEEAPDEFTCGVTARTGRIVEAKRVLLEAQAAGHRAKEHPGGIMGFQPDPQRYRSYLANHAS